MKALSVSISLLAVALLLNALPVSRLSANVRLAYPIIVARGHRTNQTGPISVEIPLTPAEDGLYRASAYATITQPDSNSSSTWYLNFSWTDEVGIESALLGSGGSNSARGQFENGSLGSGLYSVVFHGVSGLPASISTTQLGGADNSAYSVYWEVERLK